MLPELLAPAGGYDAALAAFQYGADAIYLGLPRFSARADADNITPERLGKLLSYAQTFSPVKKIYVTFNTLVQDSELPHAIELLDTLNDHAPDGLIVQDLGVARLVRDHFPGLALHASTQLAAHNVDGVLALKALGFTRVVLARELTLEEIRHIVRECGTEIEVFIHGALCYSISGLCLFSAHTAGRSGNRGRCAYCCREAFKRTEGEAPVSPDSCYPFSMKDLALAPILDEVVSTGVHSLKIEGRMKSPLYVACVTDYYRRKLDGHLTPETERILIQDLQTVFSRPWTSFYAQSPDVSPDTIIDPVAIGHRGAPIGRADAVLRDRDGVRWLRFTSTRALEKHDGLQVDLPAGGKPFGFAVNTFRATGNLKSVIALPAGSTVDVALPEEDIPNIPRGATVFCSASQAVRRRYEIQSVRDSALLSGHTADIALSLTPEGITVCAKTAFEKPGDVQAEARLPLQLTPARQPEQTLTAVRKAFERLGDTLWKLGELTLSDPQELYAPPSKLNEARRSVLEALSAEWATRHAERRSSIAADWNLSPIAERTSNQRPPQRWTLKIRADAPVLPSESLTRIDTLVLALGHPAAETVERMVDRWTAVIARDCLRLALPLISRNRALPELKRSVQHLIERGWKNWECADLAGYHLLSEQGLKPDSADWSLYGLNRIAAAEIARLGIRSFVLSPENSLDNIQTLCCADVPSSTLTACPELLVYQHTPLFISETSPCLPRFESDKTLSLTNRRGRRFTVQQIDNLWITVLDTPFCIADRIIETGARSSRIDLSWSPDSDGFPSVIRTLLSGRCPAGTHSANAGGNML